ncbi:helix-turn-helix domain-containing protein [Cupriavidus sp. 2MCAB6]|uniref:helix-turn-helix domain-containing protein n=1 Tax=Cupriavidus sp. 2MCAB6 TaxID=3232981 RepID=UPI003F9260D1
MSTVGERLREERQRLDLSQEELGARGGVRKQAQLNYEKGERAPDTGYLLAIADAGVDIAYILTGHRTMEGAVSLDAARQAAGQAYRAAQALGGDLSVEKFEKLFVTLCDTTAAREEVQRAEKDAPTVSGVHAHAQVIAGGSHNLQIGSGSAQVPAHSVSRKASSSVKRKAKTD